MRHFLQRRYGRSVKLTSGSGVKVDSKGTSPFSYGGRWFRSLHLAMDFAEKTNRAKADICEVKPDGSIEVYQVQFIGNPR